MFKHNICGDQPEVSYGMSDSFDPLLLEFFVNPKCPLVPIATEATTTEVDKSKTVKEPERSVPVGDFVGTS